MREIKFRGKTGTIKGNKWVYGYLYKVKSFLDNSYKYYIKNEHLQDFIVEEETIGQFTGLYDKNDVEIYENMEIDNKYIVSYNKCKYILKDISNGDIIDLWRYINENGGKITKEYRKI